MSISYNGYNVQVLTAENENATIGYPVTLQSNKIIKATSGAPFIGVCVAVRGDYASVQTEGYIELSYEGTAPKLGYCSLVSKGNGKVVSADVSTGMKAYKVLKVDTDNCTVGFLL
jgi:hypothetical protein